MLKHITYTLLIGIVFFGCSPKEEISPSHNVKDYKNVLNLHFTPENSKSDTPTGFYDQGSWFGFSFADTNDANYKGSFCGPFLLNKNIWIGKSGIQFKLMPESGNALKFANHRATSLPGKLIQEFSNNDLHIRLELIFKSSKTAIVKASINNQSSDLFSGRIQWTGNLFNEFKPSKRDGEIILSNPKDENKIIIQAVSKNTFHQKTTDSSYTHESEIINIKAETNLTEYLYLSYTFNDDELDPTTKDISYSSSDNEFQKSKLRWNQYLTDALNPPTHSTQDSLYNRMAVKSVITLVNNWRSAFGGLKHDGLIPSYSVWYFRGFWAWDSWKHAVAVNLFNSELAKDQIRTMFDWQDEYGMIADCVFPDSTENNYRNTKPPLSAWAVFSIYEKTNDLEFLEEIYPKIMKYHYWWYIHRDHDHDGLCEYGSTDGTRIAAAWESGMDNAVRFDSAIMLENDHNSWSLNQESIDLNAFLYAEKLYLAKMSTALNKPEISKKLTLEAEELKQNINNLFWDQQSGFFYDIKIDSHEKIKITGPEAFVTIWTGLANKDQVNAMLQTITKSNKFNTYMPFPTLIADHPEFAPEKGYWRGPVWIDQAYFALSNLNKYYQKNDETQILKQKLFDNAKGLSNSTEPIYENYNPLTGEGLNAPNFSWSAAHFLLLYQNYNQ
ncbi:MAG: glycoside hydrolase [Bacteroidales bacterium]|nr:glycoside hydrolase [Bacteroidales bacterium]